MYREIENLLNDHRKGFATTQVEQESVLSLLQMIADKTETLSVTQQISMNLQEDILKSYEEYAQNIERAYTNTRERSN